MVRILSILHLTAQSEAAYFRLLSYACTMSAVLYIYDYLLTFKREVELIWKRRLTLPTLLYIFLRYLSFFNMIFWPGPFFPPTPVVSCRALTLIVGITNFCIIFSISAIMSLRVLALYDRTKFMAIALGCLNLAQITVAVAFYVLRKRNQVFLAGIEVSTVNVIDTERFCHFYNNSNFASSSVFLSCVWWIPLTVDTILFFCTLVQLYRLRKRISSPSPLLQLIRRDGIFYYIVICVVYVLNILNHCVNVDVLKLAGPNLGVVLPASTACRLTLNLQDLSSDSDSQADYDHSRYHRGETEMGMFTTLSGRFTPVNPDAWLTGERWGEPNCKESN